MPVPTGYPSGLPGVPVPNFTCTRELFRADGLTLSTSTNTITATTLNQVNNVATGVIDVSGVANALLVVNAGGVTGSPSVAVFFDCEDFYGNWVTTSNATSISGTAITTSGTYAGLICLSTLGLTLNGRIRWTVGGTSTPSLTGVSFDLFGR
jgi:hypothetical protein